MKLNRPITFILSLCLALSAFAFDFAGKSFRVQLPAENGKKAEMTLTFKQNGRATGVIKLGGKNVHSAGMMWEVSGDIINLYDLNTGQTEYLTINYEMGNNGNYDVVLIVDDPYGNNGLVLRQIDTPAAKKSTKKKR